MSQLIRTFVAIEVPPEIQTFAGRLISKLRAADAKASWARSGQMHWTVKFLGDVNILEVPRICQAVSEATQGFAPFDVEAHGAGAFPNLYNPRTVWMGVARGAPEMIALHDLIEANLAALGYREEGRRFHPHLTLGRVRSSQGVAELGKLLREHADFDGGLSTVFELTIFSSRPGREGPIYEPLGQAELKGLASDA